MAGLAFTKGLYNRYIGEPQNALKELNIARFDSFFGESAISNMIEIYLNPLNEMVYSALGETEHSTTTDNLRAAQDLIQELNNRGIETSVFECKTLIYTKMKANLETAAKKLKETLTKNKEYVPALVNMALSLFLLKKTTDARNYLKTALKNDY